MILDETKVSELLGNNKEEDKMETDYKSHNVNVLPASPYGNNGGFGNNGSFWEALIAWGLIDRNRNTTGENATSVQVESLANSFGTTTAEMSNRLNALQISTCEQTSTIKDAIHNSSTTNLVGQNALGEKITTIGYKGDSNTKDIEKTILLDGGTTRKNDDDNTTDLKNNQYAGFSSTKDSIYALSTKTSAEHCDIKGLIIDNKYEFTKELCATENRLSTQALVNQNATMTKLNEIECEQKAGFVATNAKIDKVNDDQIIRAQQAYIHKLEHGHAKEESTRISNDINVNSKNIGSVVNSLNDFGHRLDRMDTRFDARLVAIGNDINIGRGNKINS